MEPPDVGTVLVAVDGTEAAVDAATFGIAVADRYDAELVGLYVYGRDVDAVRAGDEDPAELSDTAETFLAEVTQAAEASDIPVRTASVYGFNTHRKLVHPGSVILDAAEELDADFLVIPRESFGDHTTDGVLAKAAEYALLYASQPVLSV